MFNDILKAQGTSTSHYMNHNVRLTGYDADTMLGMNNYGNINYNNYYADYYATLQTYAECDKHAKNLTYKDIMENYIIKPQKEHNEVSQKDMMI